MADSDQPARLSGGERRGKKEWLLYLFCIGLIFLVCMQSLSQFYDFFFCEYRIRFSFSFDASDSIGLFMIGVPPRLGGESPASRAS